MTQAGFGQLSSGEWCTTLLPSVTLREQKTLVGSPCHASWWWGVGWCCWFLMVYFKQSASPPASHREPTLRFPRTKQSAAIFAYGIPPNTSGRTVCSLKPLPLLLCCERHPGMDICKIRLREKKQQKTAKKKPQKQTLLTMKSYMKFSPWHVFVTCCVVSPLTVVRDNPG